MRKTTSITNLRGFAGALLIVSIAALRAWSFTSTQIQILSMGASIGGSGEVAPQSAPDVQIAHQPLRGVSSITKIAIIEGSAGLNPMSAKRGFSAQIVPGMKARAVDNKLRVTLKYRFIPDNPGALPTPVGLLGPVYGPDPMSFAFQIDPSSVTLGTLQYQILAERLNDKGVVISSSVFPQQAVPQVDDWVTVGVRAQAGQIFTVQGGRVSLPDGNPEDGETALDIPAGALKAPTQMSIMQLAVNDPKVPSTNGFGKPITIYELDADRPVSGSFRLTLLYPDSNFPNPQDGIVDGTDIREENTAIGWWDGFIWRNVGGVHDFNQNTISARMNSFSSLFNYVGVFAAGPLTAEDRRPMQKIITPNGDGKNDTADFLLTGTAQDAKIDLYDIDGHRVRTLNPPDNVQWDGRDDSGKIVESGVYIYQYKADGQTVSGVIAVAK